MRQDEQAVLDSPAERQRHPDRRHRQRRPRRKRATETKLAALGAVLVTGYLGYLFVTTLLTSAGVSAVPRNTLYNPVYNGIASNEQDLRGAAQYMAAAFGFCALASLPVVPGLWLRRPWARDAAYGVYGLPGFVLTLLCGGALFSGQEADSAEWGLAVGVSLLVMVAAVAAPGCRRDFARVAKDRELAARDADGERRTRRWGRRSRAA